MTFPLSVELIRTDGGTQPRAGLSQEVVEDYAAAYCHNQPLPPVVVFHDGEDYWLADGFHRMAGARLAELMTIEADIRQGNLRQAVLFSCGANREHGLRRTNEDKWRAVERMLADAEWVAWSDHALAAHCGVSQPFVGKVRARVCPATNNGYQSRIGQDGRTINTSNIGKPAPEPDGKQAQTAGAAPPEPGDQAGVVAPEEPAPRKRKNGKELFDWKAFAAAYGTLYRQVDVLGNALDCKESLEALRLREHLAKWKTEFFDCFEAHAGGAKAPRGRR